MTLSLEDLASANRLLRRNAAYYTISREQPLPRVVSVHTTASMPFAVSSPTRGLRIYMDTRFLQLARQALRGIELYDDRLETPTSGSMGCLHVESTIWGATAERALNPIGRDVGLALGILEQGSMFLRHHLPLLRAFEPDAEPGDAIERLRTSMFEAFVREHETAHFEFKFGQSPTDFLIDIAAAAMKMVKTRLANLEGREVHPSIVGMFQAALSIQQSKPLMEEVWADLRALERALEFMAESEVGSQLPRSLHIWFMAQGAIHGLAALRLLALADILRAPADEQFEIAWSRHQLQFNARGIYLELGLLLWLVREDDEGSPTQQEQIDRVYQLSFKVFGVTRRQEAEWRDRFLEGRIDQLRREGDEFIMRRGLSVEDAVRSCAERLGWFGGPPVEGSLGIADQAHVSKSADPSSAETAGDAARGADRG